ncbi:MAG: hypothetical protein SFZ03_04450 [Candidatus Melainabacteria bacterium]|nr:hypothetical protein [Candidatus Melainabacteria bacterium]
MRLSFVLKPTRCCVSVFLLGAGLLALFATVGYAATPHDTAARSSHTTFLEQPSLEPMTLRGSSAAPASSHSRVTEIQSGQFQPSGEAAGSMTGIEQLQQPGGGNNSASAAPAALISYRPPAGLVIFPVFRHKHDKAFGDSALLFATELASRLQQHLTGTKILNPGNTLEELRVRGLEPLFNRMMDSYVTAGQPNPRLLKMLLSELSADGTPVERVLFVDADVDFSTPVEGGGWRERFQILTSDALPKSSTYHLESRIVGFNSADPALPKIWDERQRQAFKADRIINPTPSVFQDSDSARVISDAAYNLSRQMAFKAPQSVYLEVTTHTGITGQLYGGQAASGTIPVSHSSTNTTTTITEPASLDGTSSSALGTHTPAVYYPPPLRDSRPWKDRMLHPDRR